MKPDRRDTCEWNRYQVDKIREQLNAPYCPIGDIKKPKGMRSIVFDRRIKRLERHQSAWLAKQRKPLDKWFQKTYFLNTE